MNSSCIAHNLDEKQRTKDVILNEDINFDALLLSENVFKGLAKNGFQKPSPIQLKTIPLGRCGFDLVVKSKSGTGKTLVFSIIALEMVNLAKSGLQTLILAPTREIAAQIVDVLRNVGCFFDGLKVDVFIGGLPVEEDIKKIRNCHIAVGAPGRIKHLLTEGHLKTDSICLFVLDEADKLMETTFQGDINEIYNSLPQRKQMLALSATYPKELEQFLSNYMLSPTFISAECESPMLLGLKQFIYIMDAHTNVVQEMNIKNEALHKILSGIAFAQCLIFSKYQTRAESVCNVLKQKGWNCSFISAALSQKKRLEVVNDLKEFKCRVLISTDLTARGIDAANVDLVINYDIPDNAMVYLHRMGRAGRYGSKGICITFTLDGSNLGIFQNIIGTIGGTTLSVSVLPKSLESNIDLWNIDPGTLKQIHGTISNNSLDKNEVLKIKDHKEIGKKEKKTRQQKQRIDSKCKNDIMNNLNTSKMVEDLDGDAINIFNSLASDTSNETAATDKSELSSDSIRELVRSTFDDDNKKRKRPNAASPEVNRDMHKEKRKSDKIFAKNKALITVTKLACLPTSTIDTDIVESIGEYLLNLKQDEDNEILNLVEDHKDKDNREILENTDDVIKSDNIAKDENLSESFKGNDIKSDEECTKDVMDDIFVISYNYAIGLDEKHWLDCLPDEEVSKFHNLSVKETISSEDEESENYEDEDEGNGEEYYEFDENEQFGGYEEENHNKSDNVCEEVEETDINMRWVPVIPSKIEENKDEFNEQFSRCFQECSDNLWQTGLTFDNVEDFDNWLYQWRSHVDTVRNYVQQNIYVTELSKYQASRKYY